MPGPGEVAVGVELLNGVQDDNQRVKKKARKSCKLVKQLVRLGMETPEPPFVTFNQVLELEARAGVFGGPELKRQAGRVWLEECFALDLLQYRWSRTHGCGSGVAMIAVWLRVEGLYRVPEELSPH